LRILIDTDKLISIEKGEEELPEDECFVSIITVYEFIRGRKDFLKAKKLIEEIAVSLDVDNKVIAKATEIWRTLKKEGQLIDDRDLLIGATAIVYDLHLYTGNKEHFERLQPFGLKLYTPIASQLKPEDENKTSTSTL